MAERPPKSDLQRLFEGESTRSLDMLEADVWAAIERQTQARRIFRSVFAAQAAVLAAALISSAILGFYLAPASPAGQLEVFSSRPTLAASTLLADHEP